MCVCVCICNLFLAIICQQQASHTYEAMSWDLSLPLSLFQSYLCQNQHRKKKKILSLLAFPIGYFLAVCVILFLPVHRVADMETILSYETWERGWRGRWYHCGSRHEEMAL